MSKLDVKIAEWIQHGVLSEQQAASIQEYEAKQVTQDWILFSFVLLGVAVISTGVIALIAANWDLISAPTKLISDFIILILSATTIYHWRDTGSNILHDSLLFFFMMMCMASIGLISQVYHLHGEFYQAFMLWCAITMPVMLFARAGFIPYCWTAIFIIASYCWISHIDEIFYDYHKSRWLANMLAAPLCCGIAHQILKQFRSTDLLSQAFRFWILPCGLFAIFICDNIITYSYHFSEYLFKNSMDFMINYVMIVGLLIGIYAQKTLHSTVKFVLFLLLGVYLLMTLAVALRVETFPDVTAAMLSIGLMSLAALYYGILQYRKLFVFLTILIGLRFITVYFQVIGTLALTGIGLIVSGVLIIVIAILWAKNIKRLNKWVEGIMQ